MGTRPITTSTAISITPTCASSIASSARAPMRESPGRRAATRCSSSRCFTSPKREYTDSLTEFHIVGGLNPELPFDYYLDLLRGLKNRFPSVHLKAFTMVELDFFVKITRKPLEWVIEQLREAGMGSCPGGGAEIFAERARPLIAGHKISGARWLEVARAVHKMGIHSNATMLYGHIETLEERVDHLVRLRELQDETGGFNCFIPLAFHPENTVYAHLPTTTGMDDLKTIAVSRLMLDNFPHIKAYWVTLTPSLAQIALAVRRGRSRRHDYRRAHHSWCRHSDESRNDPLRYREADSRCRPHRPLNETRCTTPSRPHLCRLSRRMLNPRVRRAAERVLPKFLLRALDPFEALVSNGCRPFPKQIDANSLVLDAGAGRCRYAPLFSAHRYVALDSSVGDKHGTTPAWT